MAIAVTEAGQYITLASLEHLHTNSEPFTAFRIYTGYEAGTALHIHLSVQHKYLFLYAHYS
jgi:hypothetical protein